MPLAPEVYLPAPPAWPRSLLAQCPFAWPRLSLSLPFPSPLPSFLSPSPLFFRTHAAPEVINELTDEALDAILAASPSPKSLLGPVAALSSAL